MKDLLKAGGSSLRKQPSTNTGRRIAPWTQTGVLTLLALGFLQMPTWAAKDLTTGYQGLEFFGSSLMTRGELESALSLKQGSSYEQVQKALVKFKQKLAQKNLHVNADIASDAGRFYVTVDTVDVNSTTIPVRKLNFPHHIILSSEVPFQVFNELLARREQLASQGRAVTETFDDAGFKHYSDEPCNQFAAKIHKQVPAMQRELLNVISSDPDPDRRSKAIEVLNWTSDPIVLCTTFIPVVDDASEQVRASVVRFIYPRLKLLPPDYSILELVEGFSHQLARPSHMDRVLALKGLCEIARVRPDAIETIREFDEEKIKQLAQDSIIPTIRQPAQQLLSYCANPPARREPRKPLPNEF